MEATQIHWERCHAKVSPAYLRNIDPAFLEGAGGGVVSAEVAILAPMAAEGAVDARQAPAKTDTVRGKENRAEGEGEAPGSLGTLSESVILVSLPGG